MPGDSRTSEGSLITRRRHHNHAAPYGVTERFLQRLFPLVEGCARARLKFMTRAPAPMHSMIAAASSWGVALGICSCPEVDSANKGRIKRVQPGQMAGAGEFRFANNIPAMNVPCTHAVLSARVHAAALFPPISRRCPPARSGCWITTGPSMRPIFTSGLPLVRSIKAVRLTNSKGSISWPTSSCTPGPSCSSWHCRRGSACLPRGRDRTARFSRTAASFHFCPGVRSHFASPCDGPFAGSRTSFGIPSSGLIARAGVLTCDKAFQACFRSEDQSTSTCTREAPPKSSQSTTADMCCAGGDTCLSNDPLSGAAIALIRCGMVVSVVFVDRGFCCKSWHVYGVHFTFPFSCQAKRS